MAAVATAITAAPGTAFLSSSSEPPEAHSEYRVDSYDMSSQLEGERKATT